LRRRRVRGLHPDTPDHNRDADDDGYTNLEEYLNQSDPGEPDAGQAAVSAKPNHAAKPEHIFSRCSQIVFGCYTEDLDRFRSFAERAKDLGATHITITAEDLPIAYEVLGTDPARGRPAARMWLWVIRRRSQKAGRRWTRERFQRLLYRWIPRPRLVHPYPNVRFDAKYSR